VFPYFSGSGDLGASPLFVADQKRFLRLDLRPE
jgi:hypothetical protein